MKNNDQSGSGKSKQIKKIILASASPRRKEMMSWLEIDHISFPSDVDESLLRSSDPEKLTRMLAEAKAEAVAKLNEGSIVIGSDAIVEFRGQLLEKPRDKKHQRELIFMQKGKAAKVYTSTCVIDTLSNKKLINTAVTAYRMADLPDEKIEAYIESGQGMDKAGGFGCQDENGMFLDELEGCYTNLLGFPICEVSMMLKEMGVDIIVDIKKIAEEKTGRKC